MSKFKKTLLKISMALVVILIVVFLFLNFANFSSGYRAGTPIKVSHKGVLFKTWEGQLNVGGLTNSAQGAIPTTWEFSIESNNVEVREKIEEAITKGKRVKLNYEEKFVKFFWKGDTKYFVKEVEILE
ncbi:MAG: 6-phosphogluconate dehydrogenase [Bacteroidota bacterium]